MTDEIKPADSSSFLLDDHQKSVIRNNMVSTAILLFGIQYKMGKNQEDYDAGVGKWNDLSKLPANLDCSGLAKGVCSKVGLRFPDGAQNQFNFTIAVTAPKIGDFAFFGHEKNINKVYHVGMVYSDLQIVEARDFDEKASFTTGEVILRPISVWEKYINFVGFRSHPRLI